MSRFVRVLFIVVLLSVVLAAVIAFTGFKYAYEPPADKVLSLNRPSPEAYDLWGRTFTQQQSAELLLSDEGRRQLSPGNGAVKVDAALLRLGRQAFYKETFGNE